MTILPATSCRTLYYDEVGKPSAADTPRDWRGGWLEGILLSEKGTLVDGVVHFHRGRVRFLSVPVGQPTLPAYFATRTIPPGTWDLVFEPAPGAGVRPARIHRVVVAQDARTVLGEIRVPAGAETDPPATLPAPERRVDPIRVFRRIM